MHDAQCYINAHLTSKNTVVETETKKNNEVSYKTGHPPSHYYLPQQKHNVTHQILNTLGRMKMPRNKQTHDTRKKTTHTSGSVYIGGSTLGRLKCAFHSASEIWYSWYRLRAIRRSFAARTCSRYIVRIMIWG